MKNWIIYFLCVAVGIASVPFASRKMADEKLPTVTVLWEGEIKEMDVEEFALRILVSERPSEPQTIRALAIAARSIGAYLSVFGCKHKDFDICGDADCCFALGNIENCPEELLEEYKNALAETYGTALTIDGLPAMALFSPCAGSGTDDCREFTYLRSVLEDIPCSKHSHELTLPYSSFQQICSDTEAIKNGSVLVYKENDKCDFAVIGGKYVSGAELNRILGTESREFIITFDENEINVKIFGVGHGYGLNICGAEKYAKKGKSHEEILKIYYPNLVIENIYPGFGFLSQFDL